jgi:hypothetical protein
MDLKTLKTLFQTRIKKLGLAERVPFWPITAKESQKSDAKKLRRLMSGTHPEHPTDEIHGMVRLPLTEWLNARVIQNVTKQNMHAQRTIAHSVRQPTCKEWSPIFRLRGSCH